MADSAKQSAAALTTLEPAARVRAQKGLPRTERTRLSPVREGPQPRQERTGTSHTDGTGTQARRLRPQVPVPGMKNLPANMRNLPASMQNRDLVFYGGLGAMTVAGALEWPVALAIGGATWLLRGRRKEQ
ncbi:hypothetical protein ACFY0F_14500 [Streptomyces sp. NPDC001544]|uniref:hypothetical protein n=1 Tax=Streptomyces sp. NPDC001544 TaxID=3364584 RepID=UPI0036947363